MLDWSKQLLALGAQRHTTCNDCVSLAYVVADAYEMVDVGD